MPVVSTRSACAGPNWRIEKRAFENAKMREQRKSGSESFERKFLFSPPRPLSIPTPPPSLRFIAFLRNGPFHFVVQFTILPFTSDAASRLRRRRRPRLLCLLLLLLLHFRALPRVPSPRRRPAASCSASSPRRRRRGRTSCRRPRSLVCHFVYREWFKKQDGERNSRE